MLDRVPTIYRRREKGRRDTKEILSTLLAEWSRNHKSLHWRLDNVVTLPASSNGQLGLQLGSMQGVVLGDQEGLEGHTVHEQGDRGELDVQHVVMPLLIAHLGSEEMRRQRSKEGRETGSDRDLIKMKMH